jgi:hypothetical protein
MGMSPADDVTLLSRKAQAAIAAELQTGERVLLTLGGNTGGAIVLTDRRAAVWNNNALRSWSLDELSGISFESGMMFSYVALDGPEIQEKKIGLANIAAAPHAIQIADKGRARFIVDAAQRLIGNPLQGSAPASQTSFCPQCGTAAAAGARICSHCAAAIPVDVVTPSGPPLSSAASHVSGSVPLAGRPRSRTTGKTLLGLFVIGGLAIWILGRNPLAPNLGSLGSGAVTVIYRLSGSATGASITYTDGAGNIQQQTGIAVPLRSSTGSDGLRITSRVGAYVSILAQNAGASGDLTCSIEADGRVVNTGHASGAYAIATCSATIP